MTAGRKQTVSVRRFTLSSYVKIKKEVDHLKSYDQRIAELNKHLTEAQKTEEKALHPRSQIIEPREGEGLAGFFSG
jgi:hypothetical protein